jgi:hypothetical protein
MNGKWRYIICICIGILIGGMWTGLVILSPNVSKLFFKCPIPKCEKCMDCICNMTYFSTPQYIYQIQPDFCYKSNIQAITENLVKEMNYTGDYNCDEFSWELVRRYNNAGYNAHYCEGYINYRYCQAENCKHALVRLDKVNIEATTGKIITPQDFAEKYVKSFCIDR